MSPTPQRAADHSRVVDLPSALPDDREIVIGLIEGRRSAAEALYRRYGDRVNGLVWRLTGTDSDHDDLVQQVFLNIVSSVASLKDPSSLGSWIVGVVMNTVRKEIRSRRVRRILRLDPEPPDEPSDLFGPEKQLLAHRFYKVVGRMDATTRVFFLMRYVEGSAIGEIAASAGCSPTTVKRKVQKAREFFAREAARDPVLASHIEVSQDE